MLCFFTSAIKSAGVYRLKADLQKLGLPEIKFSCVTDKLVKLQRPPPDINIFLPGLLAWSSTNTRLPRCPAVIAHIKPAAPAPIMRTSMWFLEAIDMINHSVKFLALNEVFQPPYTKAQKEFGH